MGTVRINWAPQNAQNVAYLFYLFDPDHDAVLYGGEGLGGVGARLLFGRGLYRGEVEALARL